MTRIDAGTTVGDLVSAVPARSRIFERFGIDYCCGGKKTLAEACVEKGLAPESLIRALEETDEAGSAGPRPADLSLSELVEHILATHHAYLRRELPRLSAMMEKVSHVHGSTDTRLGELHRVFSAFAGELDQHMNKEEEILFPALCRLDAAPGGSPGFGSISGPIHVMRSEHEDAAASLEKMRALTDGFTPPSWACNTYRALLAGLAELEDDLHQHVHKENNVLFPKALAREV